MQSIFSIIFTLIIIFFSIVGLTSIFQLIKILFKLNQYDELQKKVIYESFAISFFSIMILHLIQLILSFTNFNITQLISPGGYLTGGIISNAPLHFDSFIFDNVILGIVYFIKKKQFGLK